MNKTLENSFENLRAKIVKKKKKKKKKEKFNVVFGMQF